VWGLGSALGGRGVAATRAAVAMPSGEFDPVDFFEGRSHGEGTLHQLLEGERKIRVDSVGKVRGDTLVLDQVVRIAGNKPKQRRWTLRPSGDGWTGRLTDATGEVVAEREGDAILIRYRMDGGLKVEQLLTPRPGWRTVDNRMKIRKFGMVVARLDETIVKR